ncbi:MAG: beta-ketoacyl-ACP synthase II [Myxococcales bacterium]|nr:beta-ketoacyl-ACP synthase II [Myxococcales bacterium]
MRRVVITGLGLVTPIGIGVDATWQALLAGKSGAGPITNFDATGYASQFACEVKDWAAAAPTWFDKRELKHYDRFLQFGVAAAMMAMDDAGFADRKVPAGEEDRWGCYIGAGLGGVETIENTHDTGRSKGPRYGFSPYFVTDIIINMVPGMVTIRTGARGPNFSHVSACSSGAHSIGEAMRLIRHGYADGMIAGGCEATITMLGVGGFNAMRAMSTRNADPAGASRPFDNDRDGFVIGEGAGVVILEELEHARARGARIYGEVRGYAAGSDAHHVTAPAPEGIGAQRCMRAALADANLAPTEIGYINAHGTSTDANDKNETAAIKAVFGDHAKQLAVSSTKSMTGHMLGAAGSVECAISALALTHGVLPPTINYTTPDPDCDLDYVPNQARPQRVDAILSNSFGFGGTNACLVLARV